MTTLSIGGYPVCGVVGDGGELVMPVQDCVDAYNKYVRIKVAEDRPTSVLPAQWRVDGAPIDTPTAWFVVLRS